jgi:hypothetical protein
MAVSGASIVQISRSASKFLTWLRGRSDRPARQQAAQVSLPTAVMEVPLRPFLLEPFKPESLHLQRGHLKALLPSATRALEHTFFLPESRFAFFATCCRYR